ncbi:MAG TPA: CADD family putative folate metabolism protein [Candidatus Marinimicrobia bacterium]|jgi:pyrroloquinoline-quinone synthase|nr:CADD family putative folate metabolism protein [Candidatus Neomarinimicrobiota bacterium]|tara:strand:+ start:182 stop:862 length:681 start_codon:yes stop_codon:yes gene_type:complete
MPKLSFVEQVDAKIDKHHLLNHPFYQAWNAGELEVSVIREYAAQYFKHVSLFPRYLSSIHTNCDDIHVRQILLENLVDEEMGAENHPELWMRFAEGMGKTRHSVNKAVAMKETQQLVNTFMDLSGEQRYHIGLAALYCYESMQPEISETKKDGLKKFYGINDEETLKFFTVHMHADKWHREVLRKLITELNDSEEKQTQTMAAIDEALHALNNFLTGMEKKTSLLN